MTTGSRIALLRGEESRRSFARRIGIVENMLRNYEENFSLPNYDAIVALCSVFDVSADWLIFGRGPMRGSAPCPRCLEMMERVVQAQEKVVRTQQSMVAAQEKVVQAHEKIVAVREEAHRRETALMYDMSELKKENARLEYKLSLSPHPYEDVAQAKTA